MSIPTRTRPIFEGLTTPEERMSAAMAEYNDMKDAGEDGLSFSNKTSMWIAFERDLESQREDRLFCDPLAKHFREPYGERLSDAMSFGLSFSVFDPPGADIGFGLEGHVMYTAARTKLINHHLSQWTDQQKSPHQVLNLGAGVDTRQYWLDCLSNPNMRTYWEVDAPSVMSYKQNILDQLKAKQQLPDPLCETKTISMDFSTESIADLPSKHNYDPTIPTGWILEGLIMYLKKNTVEDLIDNISKLSSSTSHLIVNFSNTDPAHRKDDTCPAIDDITARLEGHGWKKDAQLMFGEEGFQYNRYPVGKEPNKTLGFAMYTKN